jgi:hypothetical protein
MQSESKDRENYNRITKETIRECVKVLKMYSDLADAVRENRIIPAAALEQLLDIDHAYGSEAIESAKGFTDED